MKILGLDPGTAITGYGLINADKGAYQLEEFGALRTPAGRPAHERLCTVSYTHLDVYKRQGLTIIRMGINPSADVESALVAGPYHPAFGGLVLEAVKKAQIIDLLADYDTAKAATLYFPPVDLPLIWGHKRAFLQQLTAAYPLLKMCIRDRFWYAPALNG